MNAPTPTDIFETHRRLLFGIAYRMLGSAAEAEDAVQETFLRFRDADAQTIDSPRAWLSTVVTRLCLDQLKSARVARETYVGPWLPEPVRTEEETIDAESISMAFMVLLESLSPAERAAYLLHEVFDYSHAEVAHMLGKDEAACRQLFHRARAHVVERRPRFAPSRDQHRRLLEGFVAAVSAGDLTSLTQLLAHDAKGYSDGGGKVLAARQPLHGADAVARFFLGVVKKGTLPVSAQMEIVDVNGWPAFLLRADGRATSVLTIETDGTKIQAVRLVVNPEKLSRI